MSTVVRWLGRAVRAFAVLLAAGVVYYLASLFLEHRWFTRFEAALHENARVGDSRGDVERYLDTAVPGHSYSERDRTIRTNFPNPLRGLLRGTHVLVKIRFDEQMRVEDVQTYQVFHI